MQEPAVKGDEEPGEEAMDTETAHLSLVLEESQVNALCYNPFSGQMQMSFIYVFMQSEMETAVPARQPEKEATKIDVKKRVPLTTIANAIPAKIKWEKKSYTSHIKSNQTCNKNTLLFKSFPGL